MKNIDIRLMVSDEKILYRDIAKQMGITKEWLSRLMSEDLSRDNKARIMKAIEELRKETA